MLDIGPSAITFSQFYIFNLVSIFCSKFVNPISDGGGGTREQEKKNFTMKLLVVNDKGSFS